MIPPNRSIIRNRERGRKATRVGISLTEVLIEMGILTVGLLGVMAMFPVGSYYMQQAEIADRGSAVARQAMNDVITRGFMDPRAWRMPVMPFQVSPAVPMDMAKYQADGSYPINSYSRPLCQSLAEETKRLANSTLTPALQQKRLAQRFGSAYVLDPIGIGACSMPAASTGNSNLVVSGLPTEAWVPTQSPYENCTAWAPWNIPYTQHTWPVRRVTLVQAVTPPTVPPTVKRMESPVAWSMFNGTDDLALDIPQQGDRPANQTWETNSKGAPLSRQWVGDYSWFVSIVPTSHAAQLALAFDPDSFAYNVSVVVFYKRGLPSKQATTQLEVNQNGISLQALERYVKAKIISTSLNGGELRLQTAYISSNPTDPFQQLRTGQWIMVCGPHPASTDLEPRFALHWYRVMAIDSEGKGISPALDPAKERVVTLRGPEWPWQPAANPTDVAHLSNNLCVGIFPGAVAVHSKTIRLEGKHGPLAGALPANAAAAAQPGPALN